MPSLSYALLSRAYSPLVCVFKSWIVQLERLCFVVIIINVVVVNADHNKDKTFPYISNSNNQTKNVFKIKPINELPVLISRQVEGAAFALYNNTALSFHLRLTNRRS